MLWLMVAVRAGSLRASSFTPVTITSWGWFQLPGVNITGPEVTRATTGSLLVGVTVTASVGWLVSTIV